MFENKKDSNLKLNDLAGFQHDFFIVASRSMSFCMIMDYDSDTCLG